MTTRDRLRAPRFPRPVPGVNPEWIQHEGTHREHFDVTETVRREAIGRGIAEPISYPRQTGELLARKRAEPCTPTTTNSDTEEP